MRPLGRQSVPLVLPRCDEAGSHVWEAAVDFVNMEGSATARCLVHGFGAHGEDSIPMRDADGDARELRTNTSDRGRT